MADTQSAHTIAYSRAPFSTWLGIVCLFVLFGLIVLAVIGLVVLVIAALLLAAVARSQSLARRIGSALDSIARWRDLVSLNSDLVTIAKGLSSSYAAIAGVVASDRTAEPFLSGTSTYTHGITFGGHPVMSAIALKNIEIMKRERILERVLENEGAFRATLETLLELPIVDADDAYFGYGAWVEVSASDAAALGELWHDEEGEQAGPFSGELANELSPYAFTEGLRVRIRLRDVQLLPHVELEDGEHELVRAQRNGISPHRAHQLAATVS